MRHPRLSLHAPSKLPTLGLRGCAALAAAMLLAASAWAQGAAAPLTSIKTPDGQSAADFALDHAPPGVTIEQFVLALCRQNPQAFIGSDCRRLNTEGLQLPTPGQAGSIAPEQARAQLQALRQKTPAPAPDSAALSEASASAPEPGMAPAPSLQASSPQTQASAPAHAPSPAPALPVDPLVLIAGGAALLVILTLILRRPAEPAKHDPPKVSTQRQRHPAPSPATQRPAQASVERPAASPIQVAAPERYRPSLPPSTGQTAPAPQPSTAQPRDLRDLRDLPSLDLTQEPGPGETRPATVRAAPAAGPLDLSSIDLDLGPQNKERP